MGLKLYTNWWFLLLKGVFSIILGVLLLIIPEIELKSFSLLTGLFIGAGGLFMMIGSFTQRKYNYEWTWWLIEGLFDILVATILILFPLETMSILVILLGVWVIMIGLIQLVTAINIQYYLPDNFTFVLGGIFALVFGVLLLLEPKAGLKGVIWLIGIFTITYGIIQVYISFQLRKIIIEEIGEIEDVYL